MFRAKMNNLYFVRKESLKNMCVGEEQIHALPSPPLLFVEGLFWGFVCLVFVFICLFILRQGRVV